MCTHCHMYADRGVQVAIGKVGGPCVVALQCMPYSEQVLAAGSDLRLMDGSEWNGAHSSELMGSSLPLSSWEELIP